MIVPLPFDGKGNQVGEPMGLEEGEISCRGFASLEGPGLEIAELDAKDGGLDGIESRVEADLVVMVLGLHAMDPQPSQGSAQEWVIGRHHPTIAEAAQVLGGVEAERGGLAEPAGPASLVGRTDRLGGILQHEQAVMPRDLVDRVHVGGLTVEMDRDDRTRLRRHGRLDLRRVDIVGVRLDVDEHRPGAGPPDRAGRGEERVRRRDHLVARRGFPSPSGATAGHRSPRRNRWRARRRNIPPAHSRAARLPAPG